MSTPKVFISATTGDLRSVRQIVKEALLTINCHPVEQTNFEPDWRTVGGMLDAKIGECQALIHIAGLRYGAEPDAATLPPGTPRRSYTQMEYAIGRQLQEERGEAHFRVYTFICPETFPFDAGPDVEGDELRALQLKHRQLLLSDPHLREKPRSKDELQARILALQEHVFAIRRQQEEVRSEVRGARKTILGVMAVIIVLLAAIGGGVLWMKRDTGKIIASLKITTAGIRKQILLGSEKKRDRDLADADRAEPARREELREAALAAHASRISRLDELAQSFTELEGRADSTSIFKEMARILDQEGVDMALAYIAEQKGGILDRVRKRKETEQAQTRTELQPLLAAADLKASSGQPTAARAAYRELLALDPAWPAALDGYGWFLYYESAQSNDHGTFAAALADAEEAHAVAARLQAGSPAADPAASRLLHATHSQMGDTLLKRGQDGDFGRAHEHYTRSLALAEALLQASPRSTRAIRDVHVTLNKLAEFLDRRAQPGDSGQAFAHYARSLKLAEMLLLAAPGPTQAMRDVVVTLSKLGDSLVRRGQPGDAAQAFAHFTRGLSLAETLLGAAPASVPAKRDVTVLQISLGEFLSARKQPGDAEQALTYFTRSLEIREAIFKEVPNSAQAARDVYVSLCWMGDILSPPMQPAAPKALEYLTRALEITETILRANPGSAEAMRDVHLMLNKLATFLLLNTRPPKAEEAFALYTRSLALAETLLQASPKSALAMQDVAVTLDKLGDVLILKPKGSDPAAMEGFYTRSLAMREAMLRANPGSAQAVRDVSVSHYKLANFARRNGDTAGEERYSRAMYDLLRPRIEQGMTFDPRTIQLYEQLKARFAR